MLDIARKYESNNYGEFEVVEYICSAKVIIRFVGYKHLVTTTAPNIRKGEVKNLEMPSVFGVGFMGVGEYSKVKNKKAYTTWVSMISRCYSSNVHDERPTYIGCSVDDVWHNFQVFAVWFYRNYEEGLCLDKDILFQGNKIYAPDKCMFVTDAINSLLLGSSSRSGSCKLGVSKQNGRYKSQYNCGKKKTHIGMFETELEASQAYIKHKYELIKQIADEQSEPLKSSLLKWKLEYA